MARTIARKLATEYPGTERDLCALDHRDPYELMVATILSAQCTDERVNMVTPELFARYPTPEDLANAKLDDVESIIRSTGFFHAKARNIVGMASGVAERFGGAMPAAMEELTSLPGVGRKTANVVRSVAFGLPGLAVDTHVGRLARRLGLSASEDPKVVETDVAALLPPAEWGSMSLRLILHGRAVCSSRKPACPRCVIADECPAAFTFSS